MNRRIVKYEFEAYREARPAVRRDFGSGAVLNILQWVKPETARFTVEGEGMEVWCCPQFLIDHKTESPEGSRA